MAWKQSLPAMVGRQEGTVLKMETYNEAAACKADDLECN